MKNKDVIEWLKHLAEDADIISIAVVGSALTVTFKKEHHSTQTVSFSDDVPF